MSPEVTIGIDVGGTSMKGAIVDPHGTILGDVLSRSTRDAQSGPAANADVVGNLVDLVRTLQAGCVREGTVPRAVGVAVPGILDEARGIAKLALRVEWRGDPLARTVSEAVGLPTYLANDARAGGAAEGLWGAAAAHDDFLFVAIGTGIGAAVVSNGRSAIGRTGPGGELGHLSVSNDGPDCTCGRRGCVETYLSGEGIARRYRVRANLRQPIEGREVFQRVLGGEALAVSVWEEGVGALASALVSCCALLAPAIIVLGGGVAVSSGALLLEPLRRQMDQHAPSFLQGALPEVAPAHFGMRAGVAGAAAIAWLRQGYAVADLRS